MPLIGTSGALAINKTTSSLGGGYWWQSWPWSGGSLPTGYVITNFVLNDNTSEIYPAGIYNTAGFGYTFITKTDTTYTLPTVQWQKIQTNSDNTVSYLNQTTNNLYITTDLLVGSNSVSTTMQIFDSTGNTLGAYIDDNEIGGGNTGTYPYYRKATSVIFDTLGNYYVAGVVNQKPNPTTNYDVFYYTKFNGGTKISGKVIVPTYTLARSLASIKTEFATGSTTNMIAGLYGSTFAGAYQCVFMSINLSTNTINWQYNITAGGSGPSFNFVQDNAGNIYILMQGNTTGPTTYNPYLIKLNSSGIIVWQKKISVSGSTVTFKGDLTTDGTNIFVGVNTSPVAGTRNNYLIEFNPSGTIIWQKKLSNTSSADMAADTTIWKNDILYISLFGGPIKGAMMTLPADGSIPGTGTYSVTGTLTMTYQATSNVSVTTSSIAGSISVYSIGNATTTAYNATTISSNTAIATTTVTSLA